MIINELWCYLLLIYGGIAVLYDPAAKNLDRKFEERFLFVLEAEVGHNCRINKAWGDPSTPDGWALRGNRWTPIILSPRRIAVLDINFFRYCRLNLPWNIVHYKLFYALTMLQQVEGPTTYLYVGLSVCLPREPLQLGSWRLRMRNVPQSRDKRISSSCKAS